MNKITLIFTASLVVLLGLIIALLLISRNPSQSSQSNNLSPTIATAPVDESRVPVSDAETIEPTPLLDASNSDTLATTLFLLRVPKGWSAENTVTPTTESTIFKPSSSVKEITDKSMRITIEKNVTEARIQEIEKNYYDQGYNLRSLRILGYSAIEYSGSIIAPGNGSFALLQETAYVFIRDKDLYSVVYHYFGNERNEAIDYEFDSMIATMRFL